jgi:polar amino acid transport system substrate-binding protein
MKQIVQNPGSGKLELVEVPIPAVGAGQVLVRNHFSVVSPGTEKMAIDFARKSLLGKARSRPDLVRQVLRKVQQEGPLPTVRAVLNRLDVPQPLGTRPPAWSRRWAGPGSRPATGRAGAGYANHAGMVACLGISSRECPTGPAESGVRDARRDRAQGLRVAAPRLGGRPR